MATRRKREFRGGIRLVREDELSSSDLGKKRKREDEKKAEPRAAAPVAAAAPSQPITLSTIEHNALRETLFDIQDAKLLQTYEFAQNVAGFLGEDNMRKVWSGDDPRKMAKDSASRTQRAQATAGGVSEEQFRQFVTVMERRLNNVDRGMIAVTRAVQAVDQKAENVRRKAFTELGEQARMMEELRKSTVKKESSVIGDEYDEDDDDEAVELLIGENGGGLEKPGFEAGPAPVPEPVRQQRPRITDLHDEEFLRQVLMRRSLSPTDLEALDRVTDMSLSTEERHQAVRTVWTSVSFNAALENLTPSVMASSKEAHQLLKGVKPFTLDALILDNHLKTDFAKMVSFYMKLSIGTRPGTYRASQHPDMMWREINLLLHKFKRATVDSRTGAVYTPSSYANSSSPRKRRRLVRLDEESGQSRGHVLVVDGEVYKTLGGGARYRRSPSVRARAVSRYLGTSHFQPDYMSSALSSI